MSTQFNQYRKDGWPLCPNCEEDELYSFLMLSWADLDTRPSVKDCIESGMKCYRCSWEYSGRNIWGGKCWRCHKFFSQPEGEPDYVYCPDCRPLVKADSERQLIRFEVERMDWPEFIA